MIGDRVGIPKVVGRERERAVLVELLGADGPLVVFVHGPGEIGKSVLLGRFGADAEAAGAALVRLDCRDFEPTEHGFLDALSRAVSSKTDRVNEAASTLAGLGELVVLATDAYELFRISDPWLRSQLVPALADHVRKREGTLPQLSAAAWTMTAVAYEEGSMGWVADEPTFYFPDGSAMKTRLTAVLHQDAGRWALVHMHVSVGVPDEEVLELQRRWGTGPAR